MCMNVTIHINAIGVKITQNFINAFFRRGSNNLKIGKISDSNFL